ncbi:MAG: hypothetical protein KF812_11960 [Fimbriimonadaceae bacterium]|nr:hypothetical protein [Fimbriimonadaceae bacterium]
MIALSPSTDDVVNEWLSRHPLVHPTGTPIGLLWWTQNETWERDIVVGNPETEVYGLTELMDNNPMVCADRVSLLGPGGTLAAIALGPLAKAGLILETPVLQFTGPVSESDVVDGLRPFGVTDVDVAQEPSEDRVLAVNAIAEITTLDQPSLLDDLYEEAYGRQFFVNRNDDSTWDTALVDRTPSAVYRLRWSPGDDRSLVTIQAMGDRFGKLGAAQIVHAFNVMVGYEETLGLEGRLS